MLTALQKQDVSPLPWARFRQKLANIDLEITRTESDEFVGWLEDCQFGDLLIRRVACKGGRLQGARTPARIESHQENVIWICLVIEGGFYISQQRASTALGPGDMMMVDPSRPFEIATESNVDTLWIGVPRDLIARHIWDLDEVLAIPINGNSGAGQIVSRVLQATFATSEPPPAIEAERITRGVMDILGAALDRYRLPDRPSHYRNAIIRRIKNYIEQHIDDENLTVARIARDLGVSPRYLSKMFESECSTVSGWIRERRLDRCYADLLSLPGPTVTDIAFSHGFKNMSHFSKAFRDQFGQSPSGVRSKRHKFDPAMPRMRPMVRSADIPARKLSG